MAGALVTTNILQTLVAMGLNALREKVLLPRIVNREYEDMIVGQKRGSTVNVSVPSAIAARVVAPDVVPPAVPAVTPTSIPITLTEWYEAPFAMDDKGIAQVKAGIIPMQATEAVKAVANNVDNFLWALYKKFYGLAGTAGTTPFATNLAAATAARKLGNTQLMDDDPRWFLIDPEAEANALLLRAFQDQSFSGSNAGLIRGEMGEKLGGRWAMTQNVPTHTTTGAGTILVNDASHAAGVKTITWDGGGTQPVEGDIFTVAGDTQQYVVTSATATTILHEPAGLVALADNAAFTFVASHTANLLLHRDAIAFAAAPLVDQNLMSNENIATAVDEESGLSLRLELTRQHKQYQWSFDILYGASVVRREFGVRIAG